ncbi:MAG TPA: ABC transporter ATP-binding protein [Bacillota bacterium]|nr:ABC transporter ATP-binding protein [Bacillota bacterium]
MGRLILQTKNLTKRYKRTNVVDHVNMTIERGNIYGFIGLNGAGKSTFIRLIAGLTHPTEGGLQLFGKTDARELLEVRRRIGTLIEHPALFPNLTARENLEIIRLQRGIPGKDCIERTLKKVGLSDTGRKKVKTFSLGMRQRLGIAIALLNDPDFLLLDEPINGLDPMGVVEIRQLLKELNEQYGVTILISSHILSEVHQLATHYGIIHNGRLINELSAAQLDEKCREYLLIKVNEPEIATTILENELETMAYEVLTNGFIKLYTYIDEPALIVNTFVKQGIDVEQITPQKDTLESYFTRVVTEESA